MRTSSYIRMGVLIAAAVSATATGALDGQPASGVQAPHASATLTPFQAFRSGNELLKSGGDRKRAMEELNYAAEKGYPLAQWKLGRIYAEGDGVKRDDLKAFHYFSRIASDHAESSPYTQQARFVANAYVSLSGYYLTGIPNSPVRADVNRARELLQYAASYFGDADAQYQLARLYLEGHGETPKDIRQGLRWLGLAAQKGQYQAQAILGQMLFRGGDGVPRQAGRGLMWLQLARDAAAGKDDGWIVKAYEESFANATEDERSIAHIHLEKYVKSAR